MNHDTVLEKSKETAFHRVSTMDNDKMSGKRYVMDDILLA